MATFTGSINDKKEAWLKEKGYVGTINDMLLKYYNNQGGTSYLSITDALRNLLESSGYSGSINDMYTLFLIDNTSIDGSITDMESQFFSDSTKSFPLLPVSVISSLGIKSWIVTDDSAYVVSSGGIISQLTDKSGNGNHAVQATGGQQPSIGSGINSKATAVFGASKWLKMLSVSTKNNLLLSICKSTSATFTEYSGVITARPSASIKTANSTNHAGFTGNANNGNTICGVGQSTVAIYIDGIQVNAVNFDNYLVGVSFAPVLSPHSVIQIDNIASAGTQNFCIGADTFDAIGTRHWPGELLEIIIADNVPSAIQIVGLATYARGRGRTA